MRKSIAALSLSAVSIAGLGAGFALGTPGISSAQTASTTDPTTGSTAPASASPAADAPDAPKGPHQANGKTETPLTGDDLAKATAAAATAAPGSTVVRAETDADGDTYEVHVTKADGSRATVKLNADFTVRVVEADGGPGGKGGHGPGGDGMGRGGMRGGPSLSVVATAIGVTEADLRTALQGGQTIAQVAQAHNVTADAVIAALQADLKTRLDQQVTAGTITQAEADQKAAGAATRFADLVNNAAPAGGRGHGGKGHGPMGDNDGDGPAGASGSAPATPSTTTA